MLSETNNFSTKGFGSVLGFTWRVLGSFIVFLFIYLENTAILKLSKQAKGYTLCSCIQRKLSKLITRIISETLCW
jgi:hypothetical protein